MIDDLTTTHLVPMGSGGEHVLYGLVSAEGGTVE
jgi:hypothetical protein